MPELPEVQAHVDRLSRTVADGGFAGASLSGFRPITFTALKTATPTPSDAIGTALDRVDRRGKFLLLRFGGPGGAVPGDATAITFVVHLMRRRCYRPGPVRNENHHRSPGVARRAS